ncbi:MAG TPA: hypothetical protein VE133_10420 [Candidatus Sulfotelmatobacter sp.]|nr:hypothetical protein [Candidatus Sulfotelmatobacter sp.]
MKPVIVCALFLVALTSSALAGDEHVASSSPAIVAPAANSGEQRSAPLTAKVLTAESANLLLAPAVSTSIVMPENAMPVPPASLLPIAPSAIISVKTQPQTHRFFDTTNYLALSSVAVGLTADALSTQKGLSLPGFYEMNPVARPFVKTRAGAAVYSAGSFGLLAGGMYIAHRTNHHKLERILPFAAAGWEGLLSFRNYHVISHHTR